MQVTHTGHNNNNNNKRKHQNNNNLNFLARCACSQLAIVVVAAEKREKEKNTHLAQQSNCVLGWLIYLFLFRLKARQWIGHRSMGDTKQPARQHHKRQAAKFSPNMLVHLSIYKHISLYIHIYISVC